MIATYSLMSYCRFIKGDMSFLGCFMLIKNKKICVLLMLFVGAAPRKLMKSCSHKSKGLILEQVLSAGDIDFTTMGHRLIFNNAPSVSETDTDQGWNQAEQPYMPNARGVSESGPIIHPVDNTRNQGGTFSSQWTPAPRSGGYSSSAFDNELPHYRPMAPGPSHDHFLHPPAPGNLHIIQDNYLRNPSSSNIGVPPVPGVDCGSYNQTIGTSGGPYKRKSPCVPPICDRGSTSRYYDVGSSSDIHLPADPWQEKQNHGSSYHGRWEYQLGYGVNNLSIGGEGTLRNVRSRAAVDLESNMARTHLSSNSLHRSSSQPSDQSNPVDCWGQNVNAPGEWNQNLIPPAAHGVTPGTDPNFFNHDPNFLNVMSNHPNSSLEITGYNNDVPPNQNHIPYNVNNHLNQPFRGVRSGYSQRPAPTIWASPSSFRPGHVVSSDEGQQMIAENYPCRHPRTYPNLRLHNFDRNGRTGMPSDRYRYYTEEGSFRNRLTPEGLMVTDHTAFYGSRNMSDQHRDMRLDIDNLSYEELLALGERIGTVSTGLSDGLISGCLTESIYCSSDLCEDEGTCVICLDEYKNMDDVGTVKTCGHDFHVGCIRKWLSVKNMCPICKASAMDAKLKDK